MDGEELSGTIGQDDSSRKDGRLHEMSEMERRLSSVHTLSRRLESTSLHSSLSRQSDR